MFKSIAFLLCVCATNYKISEAAVAIQPPVEKPPEFACQEGCYSPQFNRVLPYNVPYSPQDGKSCEQYVCQDNGDTRIESCGAIGVAENSSLCIVPGNLTKPYPDCCDTVEKCKPKCPTVSSRK